jgi:hypothetical protein
MRSILVLALFMAACADTSEPVTPSPKPSPPQPSVNAFYGPMAVAVPPPGAGHGDAPLEGVLHIDDCVYLVDAAGVEWTLVWPSTRVSWDAVETSVKFGLETGAVARLSDGDEFTAVGTGRTAPSGAPSDWLLTGVTWAAPPAAACPDGARWFVGDVMT